MSEADIHLALKSLRHRTALFLSQKGTLTGTSAVSIFKAPPPGRCDTLNSSTPVAGKCDKQFGL